MEDSIRIRGARVHNLKNISLDIPHNRLTVVTGVSGSGKSSLVFDTLYAEGQRRYVESLSAYARQFLERMQKPDVDEMEGLAPPIAIRQRNTARNPRSTVATVTEIYDFLRLLFARVGRTYCPGCGRQVQRDTVDQVAARMLTEPEGSRWYVLFPVRFARPDDAQALRDHLFELRRKGFNRLFQHGRTFEFSAPESLLDIDFSQPLFALVDRIAIAPDLGSRIVDAVEICYREAGEALFETPSAERQLRFSEKFACKACNLEFAEPEPGLFSFNSPTGACPRCQGFGNTIDYDLDRVVPDKSRSLEQGAIEPWERPQHRWMWHELKKYGRGRVRFDVPFAELTDEERRFLMEGEGRFRGIRGFFARLEQKKYKVHVRVFLSRYRGYAECPDCRGARLRKEALYVRVGGKTLAEVVRMNIAAAGEFFQKLILEPQEQQIAGQVLAEIRQRLKFLNDVGLDYLTLDRLSSTLSGGEAQRIQLATCLGSRLVGACYILDEPSIGLHPRDTGRLIRILEELRDLGNTVVVVEHDADVMRAADHIVDLGPGAGEQGGRVVFQGPYAALVSDAAGSLTGRYLRGELKTSVRRVRRKVDPARVLRFLGARAHNLKGIDVTIPLGMMVVITGVSGSGKSTLVHDVVYRSLQARLRGVIPIEEEDGEFSGAPAQQTCRAVEGAQLLTGVVLVDQSPIGRTPRSNPVTYLKAFDGIRALFAATNEAQRRGYTPGHFSFNIPGGRCEACQGDGVVTVEMQFLADVELVCEECKGTRFKSSILDIRYRGLNIHEVLQLTVKEALGFFADVPRVVDKLRVLDEVGLGYLRLGQSATTLSGGEAQRVKLAAHLALSDCRGTLYIFDEPTTGLHFDDIAKLLDSFQRLIHSGGSVLIIEHNLEVIRAADWVIDLGPEGGDAGGRIVAEGPPEQIAATPASHTGRHLAPLL
ncbi:MAG: excinuclease ABC subunit UvrA [Bryobacterales bacterium]|nr:excinuclease ABC subunit UvrA [Bryobacteraceae bacterium]MDW8354733.1 excinuclease ABC subunit UvrA [Bryobacterales bacterium]